MASVGSRTAPCSRSEANSSTGRPVAAPSAFSTWARTISSSSSRHCRSRDGPSMSSGSSQRSEIRAWGADAPAARAAGDDHGGGAHGTPDAQRAHGRAHQPDDINDRDDVGEAAAAAVDDELDGVGRTPVERHQLGGHPVGGRGVDRTAERHAAAGEEHVDRIVMGHVDQRHHQRPFPARCRPQRWIRVARTVRPVGRSATFWRSGPRRDAHRSTPRRSPIANDTVVSRAAA